MLLNSVILILREVLEAALLISTMLSFSHSLHIRLTWLKWSLGMGLLGAVLYAHNIISISYWFEGVGQEVLNAAIQLLIYILLASFSIGLIQHQRRTFKPQILTILTWVMAISISLSMVREFSEIIIYLQVFPRDSPQFTGIMMGAFLGASIGLSVGIIFYHILNYLSHTGSLHTIIIVLSFVAAGMLAQAVQLLIQADWLVSQAPLWDSSAWISEHSIVGQLLYATFGYEATPSLIQILVYLTSLFIILIFMVKQYYLNPSKVE